MTRSNKWGIYAIQDGVILHALTSESDYGNRLYIYHPCGHVTLYGHLSLLLVDEHTQVKKGDLIGFMGDSGRGIPTPNKHLHIGLFPPNEDLRGINAINPVPFIVDGSYPCNTKVSGAFQELYTDYYHEGLDFSGRDENLIKGWRAGIKAHNQKYYRRR